MIINDKLKFSNIALNMVNKVFTPKIGENFVSKGIKKTIGMIVRAAIKAFALLERMFYFIRYGKNWESILAEKSFTPIQEIPSKKDSFLISPVPPQNVPESLPLETSIESQKETDPEELAQLDSPVQTQEETDPEEIPSQEELKTPTPEIEKSEPSDFSEEEIEENEIVENETDSDVSFDPIEESKRSETIHKALNFIDQSLDTTILFLIGTIAALGFNKVLSYYELDISTFNNNFTKII